MSKHNWLWNIYIYVYTYLNIMCIYIYISVKYSEQPDQQPTSGSHRLLGLEKPRHGMFLMGADDVP